MQLPEDSVRTRSSPPPFLSLSPSSLALCLAGFSPFLAQSRSGPVGTSYSTTSATFFKSDWAWISWVWTFTMAVDSLKRSTSMSGWVLLPTCSNWSRGSPLRLRCVLFLLNSCNPGCFAIALEYDNNLERQRQSSSASPSQSSHVFEELGLTENNTARRPTSSTVPNLPIHFNSRANPAHPARRVCFWLFPLFLQAVNELLESLGAPLEIVDGFVSSIAVTIPWQALLTDHCTLEVSGLQITCRPKYRTSKLTDWDPFQPCGSNTTRAWCLAPLLFHCFEVVLVLFVSLFIQDGSTVAQPVLWQWGLKQYHRKLTKTQTLKQHVFF